jgi:hypothetical protein
MNGHGRIIAHDDITDYMLAGKSVLTLVSKKTGKHYTYKISAAKDSGLWFVSLLTGPSNTSDYTYIGIITSRRGLRFCTTQKSRLTDDAPAVKALVWLIQRVENHWSLNDCEVYHDNRCGRCRRLLTVPESVSTGLGPVCAMK